MDSTETEPSDCGSPKRVISSFRRPISSSTFIVMALCLWLLRSAASSLVSSCKQAGRRRTSKRAPLSRSQSMSRDEIPKNLVVFIHIPKSCMSFSTLWDAGIDMYFSLRDLIPGPRNFIVFSPSRSLNYCPCVGKR
jgi:hypothetical protein